MSSPAFASIDTVSAALAAHGYIPDRSLATTVFLAVRLGRPVFLEGEPGVGKTALASTLATILGTELIRLQCYEGLDVHTALYEWNYPRQMLEVRLQEARGLARERIGTDIFTEAFLLERPLLRAIRSEGPAPAVLLIDEVDRADEEFEAFLLEVLSEFQVTIPELGTIRARRVPLVVLTSNRTRELHDALKRRCLYHWIDYPDVAKEVAIVQARLPGIAARLAGQLAFFMQRIRHEDLHKRPGVAETLDWAEALLALGAADLDPATVDATLGCILKYKADQDRLRAAGIDRLLGDARQAREFAASPMTR
ncbi:MAG: MoxR family ATPase [Gammaproteobacteria bacterium]|nr:MoxR family ATPase [Gammaproteobacteria bacterium]